MIYFAILGLANTVLIIVLSRAVARLSRALVDHIHNGFDG